MFPPFLAKSVRPACSKPNRPMDQLPEVSDLSTAEVYPADGPPASPAVGLDGHRRHRGRTTAWITPLDAYGMRGRSRRVQITSIDHRGIAFNHERPLAARRVLLTPEDPASGAAEVVLNLTWCRYLPGGLYSSGGRYGRAYGRPA